SLIENDESGNAKTPSVAYGGSDLYAIWAQEVLDLGGTGVHQNVYANHLAVGTTGWDDAVIVSPFGQNDTPRLAVGSNHSQVAVWTLLDTAVEMIYSSHLP